MGADLKDVKLGGDMSSAYLLVINIMRTQNISSGIWDTVFDYAAMEMERIYQNSSIDGYIVRKYDTTYDPGCAPRDYMAEDAFSWMNDNNLDSPGTYVWLNDVCIRDGSDLFAWGVASWDEPTVAFIAEHARNTAHRLGVQAIHEGLHNYLLEDQCSVVKNQILDGGSCSGNADDHNLGQVYTSLTGDEASPMLGWYGRCVATAGDCSDWAIVNNRTRECTSCTIQALEESAAHLAGEH